MWMSGERLQLPSGGLQSSPPQDQEGGSDSLDTPPHGATGTKDEFVPSPSC